MTIEVKSLRFLMINRQTYEIYEDKWIVNTLIWIYYFNRLHNDHHLRVHIALKDFTSDNFWKLGSNRSIDRNALKALNTVF